MNQDYWQKQETGKPLFPDIEWSKPEQKSARGKLLIVGGSKHGFAAVVKAFATASETGVGEVKVAMPDALKKNLPENFSEGIFLPTNPSGSFSVDSKDELLTAATWANGILLAGDSGMNAETSGVFEKLLQNHATEKWVTITRDAVDLLSEMGEDLVRLPKINLVMTFAQIQKLFQKVYYPKPLLYSQQLSNVIDALHKFTITYPIALTIVHNGHLIVAHGGDVISQNNADTMSLIDGTLATRAASYLLWTPAKPLAAIATSWQMQ